MSNFNVMSWDGAALQRKVAADAVAQASDLLSIRSFEIGTIPDLPRRLGALDAIITVAGALAAYMETDRTTQRDRALPGGSS